MPGQCRRRSFDEQLVCARNSGHRDVPDLGPSVGRHLIHPCERGQFRVDSPLERPHALHRLDVQPNFQEWLFSDKGERGLSVGFLTSSDDDWEAPIITDDQIEGLVAAEVDNDGTPLVPPALQRYWEVFATVRERQDIRMEYRSDSRDGGRCPTLTIGRTPEAHRFLLRYGRDCDLKATGEENGHTANFLRRAPEHVCRVAAVMVAWRRYQAEVSSGRRERAALLSLRVDEADVEGAAVIIDWNRAEMTRITEAAGYAEVATQAHKMSNLLWRAHSEQIMQDGPSGRSSLTKRGWVQLTTMISQRMKGLWKNPDL